MLKAFLVAIGVGLLWYFVIYLMIFAIPVPGLVEECSVFLGIIKSCKTVNESVESLTRRILIWGLIRAISALALVIITFFATRKLSGKRNW